MSIRTRRSRLLLLAAVLGALAVIGVALPVLGQAGAGTTATVPADAPPSDKPGKGPKADKVPDEAVTLQGTVGTRTDVDGDTTWTLTVGSVVYDLESGPKWFWGEKHPLAKYVGQSVTVTGERAPGSTSVDVLTVNGTAIRTSGRPPWAGGWKTVGERHPGWAKWKADKQAAKDAAKGGAKDGTGHGRPSWAGPKGPEASDDANDD